MPSMRTVHWLFAVSVALFVAGIGFVIAGGRTAQQVTPVVAPPMPPVATVKQIMAGIVGPASVVVFGAVGTVTTADGVQETAPETDDQWAVVGNSAVALVESGNLLMLPGRAVDTGDWAKMSQALIDSSMVAVKAVEAKSKDDVFAAGEAIYMACDNCHMRYQR